MLTILTVVLPLGAAYEVAWQTGDPGWVLMDYVGGTTTSYIRVSSALQGPGIVAVEHRFVLPGTGHLSAAGARTISLLGPTAAVGPLHEPTLLPGPRVWGAELVLPANISSRVLAWSMSEGSAWTWNATIAPGARLTPIASGGSGVFLMGEGAQSGLHAHAAVDYGASAAIAARYEFEVAHLFVGLAGTTREDGRAVTDRLYLTTPDGVRTQCECRPSPWKEWTAGEYSLEQESVSAGPPRILLAGVDVPDYPRFDWPPS